MHDELTRVDIEKMQAEVDYRMGELRAKIAEDVRTARAFGDTSENYEYKAAKQELRRNESRIRYLKRMIETAHVVEANQAEGEVGLFDKVEIEYEEDGETETIQLMTTLRQDSRRGFISKESPLGKALTGKRAGDRAQVTVEGGSSYWVKVLSVTRGEDDASLPISRH